MKRGKDYDARLRFSREWGICYVRSVRQCVHVYIQREVMWSTGLDVEIMRIFFLRFVACCVTFIFQLVEKSEKGLVYMSVS